MCGFIVACTYPGFASSGKNRLESVATPDAAEGILKDSVPGLKCSVLQEQLEKSLELIKHRGPDGREVWVNHDATVGLGHCRLAINDTSPTGSQPMHSADGQVHAVVIGEIYGYDELRQYCEALGYSFLGRSDSELVLALYSTHGAPEFFTHLRGEFSFVIVDDRRGERRIIAARDRFGIKPLFWTTHRSQILFAAEAKAFLGMGWTPEWDVESIATSGWLADERTIFQGVKKLAPGHWVEITPRSTSSEPIPQRYWDQQYPSKHPEEHPQKYTRDDIARMIEEVRERLVDAVRVRLRADVPMGLYLSGGIDSSAVAGIVAHLVRNENVKFGSLSVDADDPPRIKCFTVRYTDATYDESEVATRTVEWLGEQFGLKVECHKLEVDEQKLADNFEDSVYHTEHHIFDLNTTAKSVLSSLPHRHGIKAVLSGEGSDELFAGYSYFTADFLRDADCSVSDSMFTDDAQRLGLQSKVIAEMREIVKPQGLKLSQESDLRAGMTLPAILSLFPQGDIFASWVAARKYAPASTLRLFFAAKEKMQEWHSLHKSLYAWAKTILPNTILTGLGDRSEMRNSIEGRPPFLDHHLADHVNSLPPSVKMAYSPGQGQGLTKDNAGDYWWKGSGSGLQSVTEKWILREAVRPFISEEMYRRRKLMFLAPIRWPKNGPLHMMFQRILTQESVGVLGFVSWPVVQDALERGFGEAADGACFRTVIYAASWVTIYRRFKSGGQTTMDRS